MSRKSVELIVLLLISISITWFDPIDLTNNFAPRQTIFACIVYAFPAAFIALALTKVAYGLRAKRSDPDPD